MLNLRNIIFPALENFIYIKNDGFWNLWISIFIIIITIIMFIKFIN